GFGTAVPLMHDDRCGTTGRRSRRRAGNQKYPYVRAAIDVPPVMTDFQNCFDEETPHERVSRIQAVGAFEQDIDPSSRKAPETDFIADVGTAVGGNFGWERHSQSSHE